MFIEGSGEGKTRGGKFQVLFAVAARRSLLVNPEMPNESVQLLVNEHCECGENPLWDPSLRVVYWTDIPAGKIFRYDPARREHELIYDEGVPVGGFTLQENGELLLFRVADFAALSASGEVRVLRPIDDPTMKRFNDVIADPEGRVFAGTIGATDESGGLYRIDLDGTVTKLFAGTGCANGMGFSPDERTFYWTCSTTNQIFRFDYERASGELTNRRCLYRAASTEGKADGMAIDREGAIWSARWDGGELVRHGVNGDVLERITFPVAKVSSACFGGADLTTLFVTTAGGDRNAQSEDGALFAVKVTAPGRPKFRSRVLF
jgi:sugar lactone lactonase YvrE